jgi:hypothetical protein
MRLLLEIAVKDVKLTLPAGAIRRGILSWDIHVPEKS